MQPSLWSEIQRPLLALAPLADVTDPAFRRIIAKYSKPFGPSVMWTEFVSADGLSLAPDEGKQTLMKDLAFTDIERPIIAQFFTSNPRHMERAATLAHSLGFDGVDINMGCPDQSVEKQGAGAALICNPERAQEVISAAIEGAKGLPVSVKTRLGYNKDELETWLPKILAVKPAAVTIHARTRKEMSLVPARWERVKRAVEIRNEWSPETRILGNGDVQGIHDAHEKIHTTGADGAMLGRAIFGNPWLFSNTNPDVRTKLKVLTEHSLLFEQLLPHKSFSIMKKHFKAYVAGFSGAGDLRSSLMLAQNGNDVKKILDDYCATI